MRIFGLALLSLFMACGDGLPPTREPMSVDEPVSVPKLARPSALASSALLTVTPPQSASRPPSALSEVHGLVRFFEALHQLELGQGDDVRIVQYGDSHTASDLPTAATRRVLTTRFGKGGRGFVPIGKPLAHSAYEGVRGGMSKDFTVECASFSRGKGAGDGAYGLLGVAIASSHTGASAWVSFRQHASGLEIAYLEQPHGGSFDVVVDGSKIVRITTRGPVARSGFHPLSLTDTPHRLEIRVVGGGDVRLFGVALDSPSRGVVLDALGIGGAQIFTALRWNDVHFGEQLAHRAPSLVVLAYGTNESVETLAPSDYEKALVELVGRVSRAVPNAACLLVGPPDRAVRAGREDAATWQTASNLVAVVASQERVARAIGCGFYNQFLAMGGEGSMAKWASESPPRGGRDRVHLTREGYTELGTKLANDLVGAYEAWRSSAAHRK